ncbi:MAG: hypothetical protein FWG43_05500 [Clostridiales bacterium]|nr:hypothetical protein [Clostridiales bacterium]
MCQWHISVRSHAQQGVARQARLRLHPFARSNFNHRKNPWYTALQVITVTGVNLVYADSPYTWNISEVVY